MKKNEEVPGQKTDLGRFDLIARSYEKANNQFPNARTDATELLRLLNIEGWETIFETTCGTGYLTKQILDRLTTGRLISHDKSFQMMQIAREKLFREENEGKVTFLLSDDLALPSMENSSVDKFVCLGGFHHIEEPLKLIRSAHRILRTGGKMAVGDFADQSGVQKYFDQRVDQLTTTGHQGIFLSESQMINYARFAKLRVTQTKTEKIPFIFSKKSDVGLFFQMVHGLKQKPAETTEDIDKFMGIFKRGENYEVPIDYVFTVYEKEI